MTLPLPRNAQGIVDALAHGVRPAGPLLVVCHGRFDYPNATVYVDPAKKYRWDWLKGFPSVVVLVGSKTKLGSTLADIDAADPLQIDVIDHERKLGWMVLFTDPKLKTTRWHAGEVEDWLGSHDLHMDRAERLSSYGWAVQ